uniref:STAS domain-containing protein n=1 Tax=Entomoneis paludosa TaxID=265537 RepID=A0A7S3DR71_9STRA|mmetsp:Transcript_29906/g.62514  ORF Transcript_29906/g.62514 Transcript_29906/m.62514 type:complete len:814 (+) Transcript_29906:229-2670(+)
MDSSNNNNNNHDDTSGNDHKRVVTIVASAADSESSSSSNDAATQPDSNSSDAGANHNNHNTGQPRQRRPFISRHRKALDHIKVDSTQSRRHPVPSPIHLKAGGSFDQAEHEEDTTDHGDDRTHARKYTGGGGAGGGTPGASDWFAQSTVIKNRMDRLVSKHCEKFTSMKCADWVDTLLPATKWLRGYDCKATFPKDLIAGLTVGVMIVPQSMSYAKLAGLPVEYGLYSAFMPVYAYSLFGSSRQLAVGPVALISLLLATGIDSILSSRNDLVKDTDEYNRVYGQLAVQISFLVGITNIAMGLLRLGFVTIFLSHAVISGFTTGAAVIIGMSQIKYIFGYDVERSDRLHEVLHNIFVNISEFNWKTFVMGMLSVGLLVTMKNIGKTFPRLKFTRALGPLTVTALGIILAVALDLENRGIPIVGTIPQGLPSVTVDQWFPVENIDKVFVVTISIVIVGFMESIAIGKTLASKHKYEIDSSMELIGLGMANLAGGIFQSYPVTGSFSRSAVNHESGAESGISAIVTATLVALVLLFLTPIFEQLPLCVLAAIVISGVLGLLDYTEAMHLWKVHKFDFGVWVTACFGTMFLGVEIGLAIAVAVSLLIVVYESAYPHTCVLGRLPGTNVYRNIKQYPEAERYDGIVMVRIDAPLYFANMQNVRDKIRKYRFQAESELHANHSFDASLKYLILELASVSHIDTSALHILQDMYVTYKSRGQQMVFVNPSLLVMQRMVDSGFVNLVGRDSFFACLHDALHWCLEDMDQEAVSIHLSAHGESDDDDGQDSRDGDLLEDEPPSKAKPRMVELVISERTIEHV